MKRRLFPNASKVALTVAGLSMAVALTARADCGAPVNRLSAHSKVSTANMADREAGSDALIAEIPSADEGNMPGASIVGLWISTFSSGGQIVDQGFDQWNGDGTEILNDDPAPSTGNVCLGVFVRSGSATFKLKHPSWTFDNNGNVNGTAIIREKVTVAADGKSYSGTYRIDFFDLSNNPTGEFTGTIKAQRITVDF